MTTNELTFNLAGHVRHQGLPVQGVQVCIYDLYQLGTSVPNIGDVLVSRQKTGMRGEFTFPVRAGLYRLEVNPDSSTRFLRHVLPEIRVGHNTTCNINLSTGCILSGSVKTSGGKLVRRCDVIALGIEPSSYFACAPVDAQGQYGLVLPRGKYHIAIRSTAGVDESIYETGDEEALPEGVNELASESFISTSVSVVDFAGDDTYDIEFPNLVRFSGEVVDLFGQPVVAARVTMATARSVAQSADSMVARELDLTARLRTDEDGKFTVLVRPGVYDVVVEPEEVAVLFSVKESGIDVTGDLTHKFTVSEGFRLRGQVVYEDESLSQCLVRVQGIERKEEFMTRTDASGQFSIAVPGGNYKMVVSAHPKDAPTIMINDAEYNGLAPWTRMVIVGGDTHVAVRLQQGTALYGRISDDAGQARPGVRVSVFSDSEQALNNESKNAAIASGITDGEGRYCIFLSSGTYWLVVHKDFANARMVEIGTEPVNLDISWHGWCQLRFEVMGEDSQYVPRCRVAYAPFGTDDLESIVDEEETNVREESRNLAQSGLPRGYLLTGDDGVCRVTVPSGVYTLRFTPPIDGSYEPKVIKQLSISTDLTRRITLGLKKDSLSESVGEVQMGGLPGSGM